MSHVPSTPPDLSSREDTPPAPLLDRLRRITGISGENLPPPPQPLPPVAAPPSTEFALPAVPPVDRLIEWLREAAGIASQILVIAGLAVAIAAVWLGLAIAGVLQWLRDRIVDGALWLRRKFQSLKAARAAAKALAPVTETGAPPVPFSPPTAPPAPAPSPIPVPAAPAPVQTEPVTAQPVPTITVAPRGKRRRALIAGGIVAAALPALLIVPGIRYALTTWLGWGNAAVVATPDGWLFPRRPAATPPPASLKDTVSSLRASGATLVVVRVPAKAAVYPEKLDPSAGSDLKRDRLLESVLVEIKEAGARLLDLGPVLHGLKSADTSEDHVFRMQSSYWSPRAVEKSATVAAAFIQQQDGYAALPLRPAPGEIARVSVPEPVEDLGQAFPSSRWHGAHTPEPLRFIRLLNSDKKPLTPDATAPVMVIGGRDLLIYDSPSLTGAPEGLPAGENLSAGFAQYLSVYLSTTVDVHAGSHSVAAAREWLAKIADATRKEKRFIIWVLSDDDVLY